jgi:hypothetical protein
MDPGAESSVDVTFLRYSREPFSLELVRLLLCCDSVFLEMLSSAAATFCLEGFVYSTHQNHRFPPHVTAFILVEHLIFC